MDLENIEFKGTVVSFYPFDIENIHKPGLLPEYFNIKSGNLRAKEPGVNHYISVRRRQYINNEQGWSETLVPANQLCESLVNDYVNSCIATSVEARPGLFWLKGKIPYELLVSSKDFKSLLESAYNKQINWFKALVQRADDDWERARQHRSITHIQKYAATFLDLERPWLLTQEIAKATNRCESCGEMVPLSAVKCASCGFILDVKRYAELKDRFVATK